MRTTLTLEDDIAAKLKAFAHRRRVSLKEAVNALLRRGLAAQDAGARVGKAFRVDTFSSALRRGVDPLKLNQLADELELQVSPRSRRR